MEMPKWHEFMKPVLEVLAADGPLHRTQMHDNVVAHMKLDPHLLNVRLESGGLMHRNRSGWALAELHKAGMVERVKRGHWAISSAGRQILQSHPGAINDDTLHEAVPDLELRWQQASAARKARRAESDVDVHEKGSQFVGDETPEESLESRALALRTRVAEELLGRLREMSWQQFERTVELLVIRLGYGSSAQEVRDALCQGAGDQGVDGVIKQDPLGLDLVYIQAKRQEAKVGRPALQAFVGAMTGRGRKGVFFTTSTFTEEAKDYASRGLSDLRITLVDGPRLAELMIDKGLGVSEVAAYRTWRVDSDFFEEDN